MPEKQAFRTRVSHGYQVVVPAELRKRFGIGIGDEVIWVVENGHVSADFRRKPRLENIVSLGHAGGSAVETKKRVQRGEV